MLVQELTPVLALFYTSIVWKVHTRCWGVKSFRVASWCDNRSGYPRLSENDPNPLLNLPLSYYCACSVKRDSLTVNTCNSLCNSLRLRWCRLLHSAPLWCFDLRSLEVAPLCLFLEGCEDMHFRILFKDTFSITLLTSLSMLKNL